MLSFHVLGEFAFRVNGRDQPLPGQTVRAVLGALLLSPGEVVTDERLLELAWGPEKGRRHALQVSVSRLRAWLAEHASPACRLERIGAGYRIDVPYGSVDITRFREHLRAVADTADPAERMALLAAALDEWRGPVLGGRPGFLSGDPIIRTVEQARVDAGCQLADIALQLGRAADAMPYLAELADAAPYDEPLQARLVRLTHARGRQAEALRQAERVRQRLADDLGVAPSADFSSAHTAVLQGADPAADPAAILPAQLPPDVPDFTGRRTELRWIAERVSTAGTGDRQPAVAVVAVAGMAGIGKSALVIHAAHRMAGDFPDGQLYADLRGGSDRPADPADVVGWFLGALGVSGSAVPSAIEERVALYRSRTAGRRILVVLDNAADERQIRPLVPGSACCAVLTTSRTSLIGLAGAQLLELDVLPPADAVALLDRVSGRDRIVGDPAAEEIVELCGYLPLAVRIAGSHLAARPRWSLARLANELREEGRRLDNLAADDVAIRASLELSYYGLPAVYQRTFRLIGLFDALDFPAWAAADALGISPQAAQSHLEALVAAKLVAAVDEDDTGQLRYGFHDLVRLYARERAWAEGPSTECESALRRGLGAWLRRAELADLRITDRTFPPVPVSIRSDGGTVAAPDSPLAWFEAEAVALRSAVDQAYRCGFDDLAVAVAATALTFYELRDRYDDWRHTHQVGLCAAERSGDRRGRAVLLRNLAYLGNIGSLRDPDQDLARAAEARQLFAEMGDPQGEAEALALYAHGLRHLGDLDGAIAALDSGLRIATDTGYWLGEVILCHVSAIVEWERGRHGEALALLARGLTPAERNGNAYQRLLLLRTLGIFQRDEGCVPEAEASLREALRVARELRVPYEEAFIMVSLAALEVRAGRPTARALLVEGLAMSRTRGLRFVEAVALRTLGDLDRIEGRLDEAVSELRLALELWQELQVPFGEAITWKLLGRAQQAAGDLPAAAASLCQALRLFEQLANPVAAAEVRELMEQVQVI